MILVSRVVSKLKEIFCNVPTLEITPEKRDELIEELAQKVSKYDAEIPAIFLGSGFHPTSTVMSQMVLLPVAPYLEAFGINAYDYVALFSNKDNLARLLERLDEIKVAKEMAKEEAKKEKKSPIKEQSVSKE